ncbi:MAG: D-TA family PLP-dependent enzyme [Tannerella sp.]|jgi:D-serine deaminase-like pyridoxal phosphate-dependent protein|nr:D-TA family PLP-dependent enzyme [Tannerella sp.]
MQKWYKINNIGQIDSPALVVYPDIIASNIKKTIDIAGGTARLRPHVKTNKMGEVCSMMLQAGISKYKCATIAEAEMLAMISAPDVLLAYQPVGPKIARLLKLIKEYPNTRFSCLVDHISNVAALQASCKENNIVLDVFIDLNVGMNRTGVCPENAVDLVNQIRMCSNLRLVGIHGYDGHIHQEDIIERTIAANESYETAHLLHQSIQPLFAYSLTIVMGGTPTFPIHAKRPDCECSPGTFVFWDWGYKHMLQDLPFEYAALVVSRVISIVDEHHICIDLGYKSVSSESPLPRVYFLNAPEAKPVAHSEEHLVLEVPDSCQYTIGDVFYGVPKHICPTVALYDKAYVIENGEMTTLWKVIARNRSITI